MSFRCALAVSAAKITAFASKVSGRQGVTLAGKIALKIYPGLLQELAPQVREKTFVTCGTNGKTTTNNMLCAALEAEGKKVICNHTGSNMLNGVASAYALAAGLNGKIHADYACIEVDEASTKYVFPAIKPDYMVMTNLFRDQLDRYGEIDITMNILDTMIRQVPDMKVIVNADDALSAYLAINCGNEYITYGIKEQVQESKTNEIREGRFCKKCGARLDYRFYHYSQLGDYHCSSCDFRRPDLDYNAEEVNVSDSISFRVEDRHLAADYKGFYNVYNILAAYAGIRSAGLSADHFEKMLDRFNPENGRMEEFKIQGSNIILNLAKNPAGFNQNIAAVLQDETPKDIIIVINDNAQDGRDISWLWDVDFDALDHESIKSITVSGIRCQDMRLRMKYVDIKSDLIENVKDAIEKKVEDGTKNIYLLVNYTALYSTRNILKGLEGTK